MRELNAKEKNLLHRIETKPELQPFFFRKLKGLHWFVPLLERGFFEPKNNPRPIKIFPQAFSDNFKNGFLEVVVVVVSVGVVVVSVVGLTLGVIALGTGLKVGKFCVNCELGKLLILY